LIDEKSRQEEALQLEFSMPAHKTIARTDQDDRRPIDRGYLDKKFALFEREYDMRHIAADVERLRSFQNPMQSISFEEIASLYPHYAHLLVDAPSLEGRVERYLGELEPFLQCPFPLPGKRVVQGAWPGIFKFEDYTRCDMNPETVANKRVLDVGCNAGFDTFYLSTMGASEVVGIEPVSLFYSQALFLWSLYHCPNVRFFKTGWQGLKDSFLGTFDLINCTGIIYHEPHPMLLVEALFDLLAPGGKLVLESHVTMDLDMKAYFVAEKFLGDISWYWIPSVPTLDAILRSYGFEDIVLRSHFAAPTNNVEDPTHTAEGHPAGGRAFFTATKPLAPVFRPRFGWSRKDG
jgi:tRNA (mo5U34)-methyltransferase